VANGVESGSHRNKFERRAEILPLPLRSHALVYADIGHNINVSNFFHFYFVNDIIRGSAVQTMLL